MAETYFFKADRENFGLLKPLFSNDYDVRFRQFIDRTVDIYGVVSNGQPVGRIIANYVNQHLENETLPGVRACFSHFILQKAFRNQGLGTGLLTFALEDLKTHGYREFTVGVEDENAIARHIYFQKGFLEKINHGSSPCEYDLYLKR